MPHACVSYIPYVVQQYVYNTTIAVFVQKGILKESFSLVMVHNVNALWGVSKICTAIGWED